MCRIPLAGSALLLAGMLVPSAVAEARSLATLRS